VTGQERRSLFDELFDVLMRPRVRRIRRWSFLVTLPAGYLLARALGIELTLERGLWMGIAVALLDLAILLTVVIAGSRLLGRERQAVLLDFLLHPLARRAIRGEARMLWTYVRGFRRRGARRRDRAEFTYHRGSSELGFALALIPAVLAEGAVVHLRLPDGWFWPKLALPAVQAYGLPMLVAWALGPRVYPHRLTGGTLELRLGQLYVARIPIGLIDRAERRTEKVGRAGAHRGGAATGPRARRRAPRAQRADRGRAPTRRACGRIDDLDRGRRPALLAGGAGRASDDVDRRRGARGPGACRLARAGRRFCSTRRPPRRGR